MVVLWPYGGGSRVQTLLEVKKTLFLLILVWSGGERAKGKAKMRSNERGCEKQY